MIVIDHFNLPVADLELSGAFYRSVLAPLGYPLLMRDGEAIGFGVDAWRFGLIAAKSHCEREQAAFHIRPSWRPHLADRAKPTVSFAR